MNKYLLAGIVLGSACAGVGIGYFLREEKLRKLTYTVQAGIEKHIPKTCKCEGECQCEGPLYV